MNSNSFFPCNTSIMFFHCFSQELAFRILLGKCHNPYLKINSVFQKNVVCNMGLVTRKPVFGVSDKASFKPVSSATEAS